MKKIVVLAFAMLVGLSACDEVNPPYEKGGSVEPFDTAGYDMHVLLEEFTGHTCRNCPLGHKEAQKLRDIYGEKVVSMAVHAGGFALPEKDYPEDFRTPDGDGLNTAFKITAYPAGVVNRAPTDGQFVQNLTSWAALVDQMVKQQSAFKLKLTPQYDSSTKTVTVQTKILVRSEYTSDKPVALLFYIVEDSVVAPQLNFNNRIPDYVHRDVLRASPLGAFGKAFFSSTTIPARTIRDTALSYTFTGTKVVPSKCKAIVAVALQEPDFKILQVGEVYVAKKE
jgi:hypothetical protein